MLPPRERENLLAGFLRFISMLAVCCGLFRSTTVAEEAAAENASIYRLPEVEESSAVVPASFYDLFAGDKAQSSGESSAIVERLEKLEENYLELETSYDELGDDYSALKKSMKPGHSGSKMKISGRVHLDHWAFPNSSPAINIFENPPTAPATTSAITPQDRLGFRRLRFGVGGDLWKTMAYRIEAEFAGGNKMEFRDAYLGWNELPILQTVHVGNQKRPYGLDHMNSSRYNVFLERPFVIEGFNQDARRLGIQSYGVSEDQAWNWRYGVFNQRLIQDEGNYTSDHYQGQVAGRLANTFWYDEISGGRGYGHWAVSGTLANTDESGGSNGRATNEARFRHRPEARSRNRWLDTGVIANADSYEIVGLENVWNFGPLQVVSEYQNMWLDRSTGSDLHFYGGYAYVSYFLTGEHIPWKRSRGVLDRVKPIENFFLVDTCCDGVKGGWGAWQIAYRFSYADFNDDNIFGGVGKSHTFGLNWHWNAYARMQFNAIYGEIDDHEGFDTDGNSVGILSGHYTILGTRLMVDF